MIRPFRKISFFSNFLDVTQFIYLSVAYFTRASIHFPHSFHVSFEAVFQELKSRLTPRPNSHH